MQGRHHPVNRMTDGCKNITTTVADGNKATLLSKRSSYPETLSVHCEHLSSNEPYKYKYAVEFLLFSYKCLCIVHSGIGK